MTFKELVAAVCMSNATPQLPAQIQAAATEFNVDPVLVLAVVHTESRCDPKAHGSADERGLMQVIPKWNQTRLDELEINNLYDPIQGLRAGVAILVAWGVHDDPIRALTRYNGGYRESASSREYAQTVWEKYNTYLNQLGSNA